MRCRSLSSRPQSRSTEVSQSGPSAASRRRTAGSAGSSRLAARTRYAPAADRRDRPDHDGLGTSIARRAPGARARRAGGRVELGVVRAERRRVGRVPRRSAARPGRRRGRGESGRDEVAGELVDDSARGPPSRCPPASVASPARGSGRCRNSSSMRWTVSRSPRRPRAPPRRAGTALGGAGAATDGC